VLQDLPAHQRSDAVSSMVYEASERVRDPIHGCLGVINNLQKKVAELQSLLAYYESSRPQFYNWSFQESEETYISEDVDSLPLWDPI
jgi:hypothetical protein